MSNSVILKRFLQLFILGVLVYFAWLIYRDSQDPPVINSNEPQLIMNDYEIFRYNLDGERIYLLIGDKLTHYEDARGSILIFPKLTHYDPLMNQAIHDGKVEESLIYDWKATSNQAVISEDRNLITLTENVILFQPDYQNPQDDLRVTTEKLLIHDQGEKVTSDIFVKIATPLRVITGIGLIGFPHQEKFTLLEDVRSTFIVNQENTHE